MLAKTFGCARTVYNDGLRLREQARLAGELAGLGGGIDVRGTRTVTVVDSMVTDNYAEDGGGGINITLAYLPGPEVRVGPGKVTLKNTVVTGNTSAEGLGNCRAVWARIVDLGGNTDSDGTCRSTP